MKKIFLLPLTILILSGCEGIAITQSNEGGRLKTQSIELINTEEIQAKAIHDCQARGMTFNRIEKTDIGQVTDNTLLGYTYFNYYCDSLIATNPPVAEKSSADEQADAQRWAENAKEIELKRLESRKLRNEREDKALRDERIKEDAEYQRLAGEAKRQKEAEALEAKRQKEAEDAIVKKDDATCKSYGAKKGTQAYIQCRVSLVVSRQETADRQKTIDVLEKKIEALQSQMQSQAAAQSEARDRDQRISAKQYASEQEFKNKQIQLQQEQLQTLQQEAQAAREARRWQNIQKSLDAMGTVTPAAPSPFSSYRIDGRTYRCTDIGGQVNCR